MFAKSGFTCGSLRACSAVGRVLGLPFGSHLIGFSFLAVGFLGNGRAAAFLGGMADGAIEKKEKRENKTLFN
jgi:hypothetical protein